MRIVFMGTPEFAVASAEALRHSAHAIAAVVTAPDRPAGRGMQPRPSAMKRWAVDQGIPLLQPDRLRDDAFTDAMRKIAPDLIVVVAFRILPPEVYTLATRGAFNLHASLLPKYRGAAPINWAIIGGERETGVTTFLLQQRVDTGAVLLQSRIAIGDDETAGELHDRLAVAGAEVVLRTVDGLADNTLHPQPQDDALASPAPKLTTANCRIVWNHPADAVHNFVRGLSPVPAAWTTLRGRTAKIIRTRRTESACSESRPGQCLIESGRLYAATADARIEILELQVEGRARTTGQQAVQGRAVRDEDAFE